MLPVLVFDLDFTLAHFVEGYDWLTRFSQSLGFSMLACNRALAIKDTSTGFSFEKYAEILLQEEPASGFSRETLSEAHETYFWKQFQWYPSVLDTLHAWKEKGYLLFVVTAGDPLFQKKKIQHLWFPFVDVYYTDITLGKQSAIESILNRYPKQSIRYVDDKRSELERIYTSPGLSDKLNRIELFEKQGGPYAKGEKDSRFTPLYHIYEMER